MTVTIDLKPEIEARVTLLAAAEGVSVKEYIQGILENLTAVEEPSYDATTPEERIQAWNELISNETVIGPALLDDSREGIYRERENTQL